MVIFPGEKRATLIEGRRKQTLSAVVAHIFGVVFKNFQSENIDKFCKKKTKHKFVILK